MRQQHMNEVRKNALILIANDEKENFLNSTETEKITNTLKKTHNVFIEVIENEDIKSAIEKANNYFKNKKIDIIIITSHGFTSETTYGLQFGTDPKNKFHEYTSEKVKKNQFENYLKEDGLIIINSCKGEKIAKTISEKCPCLTIESTDKNTTYLTLAPTTDNNSKFHAIFLNKGKICNTIAYSNRQKTEINGLKLAHQLIDNNFDASANAFFYKLLKSNAKKTNDPNNENIKKLKTYLLHQSNPSNRKEQYLIGKALISGKYIKQDFSMAKTYFEKAANQGLRKAQICLGNMYRDGVGVHRNLERAISWHERAEIQGSHKSRIALADLYLQKWKKPKNRQQVKRCYLAAAENGHALAQAALGNLYLEEQNTDHAKKWFSKAAKQGNTEALFRLKLY